jgi:long-subunit fatty acid transport protein
MGLLFLGVVPAAVRADFVEELPGTDRLAADARSAGLGGAGIASSEESGALVTNPAAIGLLRQSEATATLVYQSRQVDSGYFGRTSSADLNSGEVTSAGIVYPVPVYRGALSFGFHFHRQSLFDRDLIRRGQQPEGFEDELLTESGSLDNWTVGVALQVSPRTFVGGSVTAVTGSLDRVSEFSFDPDDDGSSYAFASRDDLDLSGIRGSVGGLYFPSSSVRVGFRLDLPFTVEYEGRQTVDGDGTFSLSDEVSYPMAAGAGVATRTGPLLITTEAEFIPYSLLELDGERLRTDTRQEGYRDVVVARAGLEWTLPVPVRLRAGYRYEPDPFRLILAEVTDPSDPALATMEVAEFTRERHVVTAGAGFLLEGAMSLDLAAEWSRSEKTGTNVDQNDEIVRLHFSTAYRF